MVFLRVVDQAKRLARVAKFLFEGYFQEKNIAPDFFLLRELLKPIEEKEILNKLRFPLVQPLRNPIGKLGKHARLVVIVVEAQLSRKPCGQA